MPKPARDHPALEPEPPPAGAGPRSRVRPDGDPSAAVLDLPLAEPLPTDREPQDRRHDTSPALAPPSAGHPTGSPGPPTVPDTPELLDDHVVPALRERGVLRPNDRVRTRARQQEDGRPPPPGTVTVALGTGRRDAPPALEEPAASERLGDVHVHIDRVEVIRSAPAPDPAPVRAAGPPAPSRLEIYLDQRRTSRR